MSTPTPASKPWFKNWKIIVPILAVLAIIGMVFGPSEESSDTTASEETSTAPTADDAFQNCDEVREAGITELTEDDERWNSALDRDGNGVACESNQETPAEETTVEQPEETPATQADSAPLLPAGVEPHPLCEANNELAQMITGVLNDSSQTVANGHIIDTGDDTWIAASIIDANGEMESRSDVWLMRDGAFFTVSGGARQLSWAAAAPGVSMSDEYAHGVDSCVVAATLNQ